MRRKNITWVWLLGAAFMVGCGKQVPEILSSRTGWRISCTIII